MCVTAVIMMYLLFPLVYITDAIDWLIFRCLFFVDCRHSNLTQQMLIFKAALCVMHLIVIQTYSPWNLSTYRLNPSLHRSKVVSFFFQRKPEKTMYMFKYQLQQYIVYIKTDRQKGFYKHATLRKMCGRKRRQQRREFKIMNVTMC